MTNQPPASTNQPSQSNVEAFDVWRGKGDNLPSDNQQRAVTILDKYFALPVYEKVRTILLDYSHIESGDVVLDAGCGVGLFTRVLASQVGETGRAIGVERNDFMLDIARERSAKDTVQAEYRTGDITALEFDDETFDVVWCLNTIEWIADPMQAISELARVLKPGGRLICKSVDWGTVVNGRGDPEANDILGAQHRQSMAHPREVRRLPKRYRDAGLESIQMHGECVIWDAASLNSEDGVFRADGVYHDLDQLFESGTITRNQHQYMTAEAQAARQTESEYVSQVMMIVAGTKPPAR